MSIPILANDSVYIQDSRAGLKPEALVKTIPSAVNLTEGHLDGLAARLRDMMRTYSRDGRRPIESDAEVAKLVHGTLRLDRRTAAERRFWALLSAVKAPDFVDWRWGYDDHQSPLNRFNGGWKDTFRRLWYRAELSKTESTAPWIYLDLGGEDFWVGIIEREFCQHRELVQILLRWWFGEDGSRERSMAEHRRFFTALTFLQPYRAIGCLDEQGLVRLFDEVERLANRKWLEELAA